MPHLQLVERPPVLKDRDRIFTAVAHALLALECEKAQGHDSLRHLANTLLRHLTAHGCEVRRRRAVRP